MVGCEGDCRLDRARSGTIDFGFVGVPPGLDSPELLDAFGLAHPEIDLCYRELPFPSHATSSWLEAVDLAVCHLPPLDPSVRAQVLRGEPRVVLAPARHPLVEALLRFASENAAYQPDDALEGMTGACVACPRNGGRGAPIAWRTPPALACSQPTPSSLRARGPCRGRRRSAARRRSPRREGSLSQARSDEVSARR
jgi:DNA-binding transcriptional LysR family regulator